MSQCTRARAKQGVKSRAVGEGFDVLFARARVHCDNKPRQIGLNHDYNMTFSISTHECQYSPRKDEYRARSESRSACYCHCYVTWRHLTTVLLSHNVPVVKGCCARDALPAPFISAPLNATKISLAQQNIFTMTLRTWLIVVMLFLIPMIGGISHKRFQWLA